MYGSTQGTDCTINHVYHVSLPYQNFSPDVIPCGWLGLKHQLSNPTQTELAQFKKELPPFLIIVPGIFKFNFNIKTILGTFFINKN